MDDADMRDAPPDVDFLQAPEQSWSQPAFEHPTLYIARNYYYHGAGEELRDQELSVATAEGDALLQAHLALSREQPREEVNPGASNDRIPLQCLCCSIKPAAYGDTFYAKPLDRNHIRLLEIFPGNFNAPIACRLHVADRAQAAQGYEALSYVWGEDPEDIGSISCNGRQINLRRNLCEALQCLRDTQPRVIWVDALSINQGDPTERSEQVEQVHATFQNARRVIAWLGTSPLRSWRSNSVRLTDPERALSGVCQIINSWRRHSQHALDINRAGFWSGRPNYIFSAPEEPIAPDSPLWEDVFALFNCVFFTRLWVIQEICVARSVSIAWAGSVIQWEWIGLAAAIVRDNYYRIQDARRPRHQDGRVGRLEMVPRGVLNVCFIYRISVSMQLRQPAHLSFHQLLMLSRRFACRDQRDRVYGLLGLPTTDNPINVGQPFIKPDYRESTAEVYHEAALRILASASPLSLLSSVQHRRPKFGQMRRAGENDDPPLDIPSWVPQWQLALMQTIAPLQPDAGFAAGGGQRMHRRESDPSRLELLGIITESITSVSSLGFMSFWRGESARNNWDTPAKEDPEKRLQKLLSDKGITQERLETLALTLTGGKDWYGFPVRDLASHTADYAKCLLKEGLWWSLRDLRGTPQTSPESSITISQLRKISLNGQEDRFLDATTTACKERLFFTTSSGHPVIGPAGASVGDLICVFHGANVPFAIRPLGQSFTLLGECFVRDLMHGEAVTEASKPGSKLQQRWIGLQ